MIEIEASRMAQACRTLAREMDENRLKIVASTAEALSIPRMGNLRPDPIPERRREMAKRAFDWEIACLERSARAYEIGCGNAWLTLSDAHFIESVEAGRALRKCIEHGIARHQPFR
jgi:hypothetical protein